MTHSAHARNDRSDHLADPDPLLAAVPGLLGFTPDDSLVLIAFDADGAVIATMRHDLMLLPDGRPARELKETLEHAGGVMAKHRARGMVAVVVDATFDSLTPKAGIARYRKLLAHADRAFAAAGGVRAGFAMAELCDGALWHTCWHPSDGRRRRQTGTPFPYGSAVLSAGRLSDPAISAVALERAVQTGRPILPRRSDIPDSLRPIPHCTDAVCRPLVPEVVKAPPGMADQARIALVIEWLESGELPQTCEEVNELAEAISSVHTRDVLLAFSVTQFRDFAELLWSDLTRRLTGRPAAAAATLLGHLYYVSGEGAFATVALERALTQDPTYQLAHLLMTALTSGMRPSEMAGLVELSFELAENLAVPLPEQTMLIAG